MHKILILIAVILALAGFTLLNQQPTKLVVAQKSTEINVPIEKISVPEGAYLYKISEPSTVSYVSLKKFFNQPEAHVTGTSTEVSGDGWFNPLNGSGFVSAYIDIKTLVTDNKKRDEDVAMLFSEQNVRFTADLGDLNIGLQQPFEKDIPGQITINGISRDVVFKVNGMVSDVDLSAKGSTIVKMSDFGITPPSLINVFTADDNLELTFDIKADRIN